MSRTIQILALPFAGGNKYSYTEFERSTPKGFKWHTLELPGRGSRVTEPFVFDMNQTVNKLFRDIKNKVNGEDYVVFGHSMGALVGFLLAKRLNAIGKSPLLLFLTGREGPTTAREEMISTLPGEQFWEKVRNMGGVREELFENPELISFIEPVLRADFKIVEEYNYCKSRSLLNCPFYIMIGDREDITEKDLMSWKNETTGKCEVRKLPGNHFFLFDHSHFVLKQIIRATEMELASDQDNHFK